MAEYEQVLEAGKTLDLEGCAYGEWRDDFVTEPHVYYYFVAGLVLTRGYTRVVEIGTHWGGAITAMSRGVAAHGALEARLVTLDVIDFNESGLAADPFVHCIRGDSLDPKVVRRTCAEFDRSIDLLYVDSRHERVETLQNIAIYANRLHPKVIVVDDIHLNPQMRDLWAELQRLDPGEMTDVSELVDRKSAGFGVIECRDGFRWPELGGLRRAVWHGYRRARAIIGPHVPSRARQLLRPTK